LTFTHNSNGKGIKVEGSELLSLAPTINTMTILIPETQKHNGIPQILQNDFVNINIDYGQTGIGGDNSWVPLQLP
jgi:beta-galactosidase